MTITDEPQLNGGQIDQYLYQAGRENLGIYTGIVHKTDSGSRALPPPHIQEIMDILEDDSLGHTVIVAPPGSAKTATMISFVGYMLGRDPTLHVAYVSNTAAQASRRSLAIRDTIALNEDYKKVFPDAAPDPSKGWAEAEWTVKRPDVSDKDPTMLALGVFGPLLGQRVNLAILDDIADQENMATPHQREKVRDWLEKTFMTRLTPDARVVMICTRWAADDPADWATKQGWHLHKIPALSEGKSYWPDYWPNYKLRCDGPHNTIEGKFCWQEPLRAGKMRKGRCKFLEVGGELGFTQQFMAEVVDESSSLIGRNTWQYFEKLKNEPRKGGIFIDTAHEEKKEADYSVILVGEKDGPNLYIRDIWRDRVNFPKLVAQSRKMREKWGYPIFVENTVGAKPLIDTLKQELSAVHPWQIKGRSKVARVQAVLDLFEGGNVWVPKDEAWVLDLIEECAMFPVGEHDDQVDALSMFLLQMGKRRRILSAF